MQPATDILSLSREELTCPFSLPPLCTRGVHQQNKTMTKCITITLCNVLNRNEVAAVESEGWLPGWWLNNELQYNM